MGSSDATNLPTFSPVVRAGNVCGGLSFGYEWQLCLRPVVFFKITFNGTTITQIVNVTTGRASECHADNNNRIFAPMPGEVITQVDVCCSASYIRGLRFHTNKRTEEWLGSSRGVVSAIKASDGFGIHSFAGERRCERGAYQLTGVAVLFTPLKPPVASHTKGSFTYWAHDEETVASTAFPDMRAIMIKTTPALASITALSEWDVQVLASLSPSLDERSNEHLVKLLPDERVRKVRLVQHGKVQFETTHRTTPWFGKDLDEVQEVDSFEVTGMPEGSYICGFHAYNVEQQTTPKLGVVYWTPDQ